MSPVYLTRLGQLLALPVLIVAQQEGGVPRLPSSSGTRGGAAATAGECSAAQPASLQVCNLRMGSWAARISTLHKATNTHM